MNKLKDYLYFFKSVTFLCSKCPTWGPCAMVCNAVRIFLVTITWWVLWVSWLPCGEPCQRYVAQTHRANITESNRILTSVSVIGLTQSDRPEVWQAALFDRISYFKWKWMWHLIPSKSPGKHFSFFMCSATNIHLLQWSHLKSHKNHLYGYLYSCMANQRENLDA